MLQPIKNNLEHTAIRLEIKPLSSSELAILEYFLQNLPTNIRVPMSVPLRYITRETNLNYKKVQYNINKLIRKKLIERWIKYKKTPKQGLIRRQCFYRLADPELCSRIVGSNESIEK